jgi:hypothetical protein
MCGPQSDDQPWHADLRSYQIDDEPKGVSAPSPCFMHQRHIANLVHPAGDGDSVGSARRTESHLPQFPQK